MRCNAEFYYVGKIPRTGIGRPSLQRGVVLKWFYSPRAVGTPLSEVNALHRVPFKLELLSIFSRVQVQSLSQSVHFTLRPNREKRPSLSQFVSDFFSQIVGSVDYLLKVMTLLPPSEEDANSDAMS